MNAYEQVVKKLIDLDYFRNCCREVKENDQIIHFEHWFHPVFATKMIFVIHSMDLKRKFDGVTCFTVLNNKNSIKSELEAIEHYTNQ